MWRAESSIVAACAIVCSASAGVVSGVERFGYSTSWRLRRIRSRSSKVPSNWAEAAAATAACPPVVVLRRPSGSPRPTQDAPLAVPRRSSMTRCGLERTVAKKGSDESSHADSGRTVTWTGRASLCSHRRAASSAACRSSSSPIASTSMSRGKGPSMPSWRAAHEPNSTMRLAPSRRENSSAMTRGTPKVDNAAQAREWEHSFACERVPSIGTSVPE